MRYLVPSIAALCFVIGCSSRPDATTGGAAPAPAATTASAAPAPAADLRQVWDLPRLPETLAIDGDGADWAANGLAVTGFIEDSLPLIASEQFSAEARLGWNARGLAVLVRLHSDQAWSEADAPQEAFKADSVELFLRQGSAWANLVQPVIAPGMAPGRDAPRSFVWDYRGKAEEWAGVATAVEVGRKRESDGATIEAIIPWSQLRLSPTVGTACEFAIKLNKVIDGQGRRQLGLTGPTGDMFQRLRLSETATAAIDRNGALIVDMDRIAVVSVAPAAAAGVPVTLQRGDNELLRIPYQARGQRAVAFAFAPVPAAGDQPLTLTTQGRQLARIKVPDVVQDLRRTLEGAASRGASDDQRFERLRPRVPSLLTGPALPAATFPDPTLARNAGVTGLAVQWYGADRKPVTTAEKPGRYGAVITATLTTGKPVMFYQTVVRLPGDLPAAGLAKDVLHRLGGTVEPDAGSVPLLERLGGRIAEQREIPVQLAALLEAAADGQPPRPLSRDLSWWYALRTDLGTATVYEWFRRLPKGYESDTTKRWPAVIYLHGGGDYPPLAQRNQESDLLGWAKDKDLPMAIYALQSFGGWDPPGVISALDRILASDRIDPDRVVIVGFSMGASGIFEIAARYPERFAGAVTISGRPNVANIPSIAGHIPLWSFHGDKDGIADVASAQRYSDALKAAGGDARLTILPGADHVGSMNDTFPYPGLWEWVLGCRRVKK